MQPPGRTSVDRSLSGRITISPPVSRLTEGGAGRRPCWPTLLTPASPVSVAYVATHWFCSVGHSPPSFKCRLEKVAIGAPTWLRTQPLTLTRAPAGPEFYCAYADPVSHHQTVSTSAPTGRRCAAVGPPIAAGRPATPSRLVRFFALSREFRTVGPPLCVFGQDVSACADRPESRLSCSA